MNTSNIALDTDVTAFFEAALQDAISARELEATDAASQYVVVLLCDFAQPGRVDELALDRPSTFLLREALQAKGAERFRRLRKLGDGILYLLGFFRGSVARGGADQRYVMGVGSSAYRHAAAMLHMGGGTSTGPDVLGELAGKFDGFVSVLNMVADSAMASSAQSDAGVLRLYERWCQTGSERLAEELCSLGLLPSGRGRGPH